MRELARAVRLRPQLHWAGGGIESTRFPGALRRGGDFEDGTNAGPFAIIGTTQPSGALFFLGFRGAR